MVTGFHSRARRFQCSTFCDKCVEVCPNRANYPYDVEPVHWTLPVLACRDGTLAITGEECFEVNQPQQILHVDDFCNECGNSATFCVHHGKPYTDKPRPLLQEADLEREDDNAFYVERETIRRRERGQETRLTMQGGALVFENTLVRLNLSPQFAVQQMALKDGAPRSEEGSVRWDSLDRGGSRDGGDTQGAHHLTASSACLLLRVTLFDHRLAELDEQARETEKGAGWPPGMSGAGFNCCGPVRG